MSADQLPDASRAAFERWHNRFDQQERAKPIKSGLYRHTGTQAQWDAWQASHKEALGKSLTFDGVSVVPGDAVWVLGSTGIYKTKVQPPVTCYELFAPIPVSKSFSTKESDEQYKKGLK